MNSVVSPLRMPPTSTSMAHHHHQPPYHASRSRHQRHASNPQVLLTAARMHVQPQQLPPHQQQQQQARPYYHYPMPQYQQTHAQYHSQMQMQMPMQQFQPVMATADHGDVLARAQAIAQAQAQIQAQMQLYATAARPVAQPTTAASTQSTHAAQQASATRTSSRDAQAQSQPQQTLHQLHQRSGASGATQQSAKSSKSRSRASSASTESVASSSSASSRNASSERVEWRVAIDPKTKRAYYYHPVTRETTWKKPQQLVEKEAREKKQFFSAMEHNIRSKLRAGTWLTHRDSNNADDEDYDDRDAPPQPYRHSDIGMSTAHSSAHVHTSVDRVRNSLSSMDVRSGRRQPKSRASLSAFASRSAPTTPDFSAQSGKPADVVSNQDSTDDDDVDDNDDDDDDVTAAAASKPPMLFRTLSSYETPVVVEKKTGASTSGAAGSRLVAIPSPIQERVRLATAMQPRASDLESYAQSVARPETESTQTPMPTTRQPLRRRSNSTSTIYVRMGTMNAPDQDCTIKCVATVLRAHMVEAAAAPIAIDAKFDVFINRRDRELLAAGMATSVLESPAALATTTTATVPSLQEIGAFIKHVFSRAQMESECIVMSLIYVERLLKATSGSLQLRAVNWRAILFCSMVMASKVWDDLSMCNADFSRIWPELSLKEINELELAYLSAVEYNVRVSAVSYAKYYFHLRSMCATMGLLAAFDESAPLNLDGARKMQVLSEEYQERAKLLPAPRRRSVTITATSVESRAAATHKASKASPAASLEELVHMQVRGAGGRALSSMHRVSNKH